MIRDAIPKWAKVIGATIGAVAALYGAFTFIHDIVETPRRLATHEAISRVVHDSARQADDELHEHAETQEKLLEAIVRGECIENPKANLARQGLLNKCRQLGIDR
jgi:hypothetical protein